MTSSSKPVGDTTPPDVVSFLIGQHQRIKQLFGEVLASSGDQRRDRFTELRRLLAVHETAEEEIVHPRARRELADGADVVDARLQEENEAKRTLTELEKLDVDSAQFEKMFQELQADVLNHAQAEEQMEFGRLAGALDTDDLKRMKDAVQLAESMAPTRPHPGVESARRTCSPARSQRCSIECATHSPANRPPDRYPVPPPGKASPCHLVSAAPQHRRSRPGENHSPRTAST